MQPKNKLPFLPACGVALLVLFGTLGCSDSKRQAFPFDSLVVDEGNLSSSLAYNPHSDYPPKLRWNLGVNFEKIQSPGAEKPDSTFISYTVDLGHTDWRKLPGKYPLNSDGGSDLLIDSVDYGPVDLRQITIKPVSRDTYDITLDLLFHFEGVPFKKARRAITFRAKYDGFSFYTPIWTNPDKVTFPAAWKVPSASPTWSDKETREFVSRHVDLSAYGEMTIDRNDKRTLLEAKP